CPVPPQLSGKQWPVTDYCLRPQASYDRPVRADSARGSLPGPVLKTVREAFALIQLPGGRPLSRYPRGLLRPVPVLRTGPRPTTAWGLGSPAVRPQGPGPALAALPSPVCSGGSRPPAALPSVRSWAPSAYPPALPGAFASGPIPPPAPSARPA